jgi:hypothetical protein
MCDLHDTRLPIKTLNLIKSGGSFSFGPGGAKFTVMPVWGRVFEGALQDASHTRGMTLLHLRALVGHIRTLQQE